MRLKTNIFFISVKKNTCLMHEMRTRNTSQREVENCGCYAFRCLRERKQALSVYLNFNLKVLKNFELKNPVSVVELNQKPKIQSDSGSSSRITYHFHCMLSINEILVFIQKRKYNQNAFQYFLLFHNSLSLRSLTELFRFIHLMARWKLCDFSSQLGLIRSV